MAAHLFIVSRHHPDLYAYLSREFAAEADVEVVLDRRQGQRRKIPDRRRVSRGDRRQGERRAQDDVTTQLSQLGYAFVRTA